MTPNKSTLRDNVYIAWKWVSDHRRPLAVAIVIGACVVMLVCTLGSACEVPSRRLLMKQAGGIGCWEFWLNRYQTLIVGVVAFVGAFLTVQAVRAQIQQADRLEDERRERESYAARATLPLALSAITGYAEGCMHEILAAHAAWRTGSFGPVTLNMP